MGWNITSIDKEEADIKIKFVHPHDPRKTISWSTVADTCSVPLDNILVMITASQQKTGRTYTISNSDYDETMAVFNAHYS